MPTNLHIDSDLLEQAQRLGIIVRNARRWMKRCASTSSIGKGWRRWRHSGRSILTPIMTIKDAERPLIVVDTSVWSLAFRRRSWPNGVTPGVVKLFRS